MTEIRHGYTMQQVDILVRRGIIRNTWYRGIDVDERYATGWHAAIELLYTAEIAPKPWDLMNAAWRAADHWTGKSATSRGAPRQRGEGYTGRDDLPKFHAYWCLRTVGPVDEPVIDRLALAQIWPRLRPEYQEALQALAAHEDYSVAAEALGLKYHTFCARIRRARNRFDELWMEGETPRKRWHDKRIQTPGGRRQSLSVHLRRRRQEYSRTPPDVLAALADAPGDGKTSMPTIEGAAS